ncbi:hypothetical protein CYMTET_55732 [Cymbomonas tetramitiformis]|uniref:Uncharacterized protein n=1 Tax=Cymbomonas tetramitiformis TaxID=36881 RepID=A0AAE0BDM2_9CHLO|nr:hypothetical protein CYMTET_55732 [Cymbomonas tetramitiformis]
MYATKFQFDPKEEGNEGISLLQVLFRKILAQPPKLEWFLDSAVGYAWHCLVHFTATKTSMEVAEVDLEHLRIHLVKVFLVSGLSVWLVFKIIPEKGYTSDMNKHFCSVFFSVNYNLFAFNITQFMFDLTYLYLGGNLLQNFLVGNTIMYAYVLALCLLLGCIGYKKGYDAPGGQHEWVQFWALMTWLIPFGIWWPWGTTLAEDVGSNRIYVEIIIAVFGFPLLLFWEDMWNFRYQARYQADKVQKLEVKESEGNIKFPTELKTLP